MDAKTSIKKRLPSRHVTEGPERAPHRSYLYAMGLTTEQIHQPFVGVASCWNEAAPCNISLMRQAQAVKKGVASAGGTPREFCTITVTDGIAMGHDGMRSSLPSRECIADSVELTIRGHAYDALVGLAGCDKSLPGMMMAMVRLNVPSIFIYGGSILPGNFRGQQVTVQDMFEAVGKHSVGEMSDADLDEIERVACPSAGACGAQFTANTMATVSEAIGLALPYSAGAPAPYEIRDAFCTAAGEKVMELIAANIRPRDIVTRSSLENAAAVVAASGGSTNAALHLPAIAHECGIKFDLFDVAEIFKKTPYVADLKPGGRYVAKDMFEAGGIPLLMKTLLDNGYLHGRLHDGHRPDHRRKSQEREMESAPGCGAACRQADHRHWRRGRPEGQSRARGRDREGRRHVELEISRTRTLFRSRRGRVRGGPKRRTRKATSSSSATRARAAAPACARCFDHRGADRSGHGRQDRPHHRRPLLGRDPRLLHRPCRAGGCRGRPDRPARATAISSKSTLSSARLTSKLTDAELAERKKTGSRAKATIASGALWKYAQQVGRR